MKEDLRRLINEFLDQTRKERTEKVQHIKGGEITHVRRSPTFQDFIWWLNE